MSISFTRKNLGKVLFIAIPFIALAVFLVNGLTPGVKGYSSNDFKTAAGKYLQGAERAGTPITLRHDGDYYYYVPIEVNETITSSFPGIMLGSDAKSVTDETILKELYRYPGLVLNYASNIKGFNEIAAKKVALLAQYCRKLDVQRVKAQEVNMQGNVVGVIYHGIKLAADAVGLVKAGTKGALALAKDLAKGAVQNKIISYFTSADSTAILESTQAAFDKMKSASASCASAMQAWNASVSTTGKASSEYALKATEDMYRMFAFEADGVEAIRDAVQRINFYPKAVTKIGKTKYGKAVSDLTNLADRLTKEGMAWSQENENANDENNLNLWIAEQLDRVGSAEEAETPAAPAEPKQVPLAACTTVDFSEDYKLYTYTPDNPGTNGPCNSFANNVTSGQVSLSCSTDNRFRNHWVKKISTAGLNKMKIKADLTIDDRGFFSSMCPNGGVKYDNYSSLLVLSKDPTPVFDAECNKISSQEDWPKCGINTASDTDPFKPHILGTCGVPKCATEALCEFEVNTAGQGDVWLVFHTSNPWPAYVTGTMSGVEICPAQ